MSSPHGNPGDEGGPSPPVPGGGGRVRDLLRRAGGGAGRRRLGLAAAGLALAFLAVALVRGWSQVTAYPWDLAPLPLAAGAVVLLVFFACSGAGYVAVVAALSPHPPRVRMLAIWAISLVGRYVPGSVVMVIGRVELARDAGVARRASLAATVYEQALGLGVAAIGSLAFVAVYGSVGSGWTVLAVAAVPLALVVLHPRVFGPLSRWLLGRAGRPPLDRLIPPGRIAALAAWYAVTAVLLAVGVWLTMRGMGGPAVGSLPYVGGAFLFAFTVSMLAVVFPSGLGIRDGVFALALAQNVPGGVAVALSVGSRLVLTLVEIAFVLLAVGAAGGRRRLLARRPAAPGGEGAGT